MVLITFEINLNKPLLTKDRMLLLLFSQQSNKEQNCKSQNKNANLCLFKLKRKNNCMPQSNNCRRFDWSCSFDDGLLFLINKTPEIFLFRVWWHSYLPIVWKSDSEASLCPLSIEWCNIRDFLSLPLWSLVCSSSLLAHSRL